MQTLRWDTQFTWLMLVLNVGAVYRLTVLVTADKITERLREHVNTHWEGALVILINCGWCISIWLAGLAVLLTWLWWPVWIWICVLLVCSAVSGILSELIQ